MLRGVEIRKIQAYREKPVEKRKSQSEKRENPRDSSAKEEGHIYIFLLCFNFDVTQVSVKRAVPPETSEHL